IIFPDYLVEELGGMLSSLAEREGYILDETVLKKASNHLDSLRRSEMHFGNGRAVRNLFGEMKMNLARRLMGQNPTTPLVMMDRETLVTYCLEDVPGRNPPETVFYLVPYQTNLASSTQNSGPARANLSQETEQLADIMPSADTEESR
ncbi:MAG TPA: hypothetical protein VK909_10550, partial [Anaerolineales bacterium]|nr:hypothetical protein [Anaerolineales bacterium]